MGAVDSSQGRSRLASQHWEQLSCGDGKTHGSAKLEDGGQNIIPLCFPWELVSHCVLLVPVDLGLILLLATR